MTKYWVQMDGHCDIPLTKEELFFTYGNRLTGDTPCAKAGENKWGKLIDFFPDWQNPILDPSAVSSKAEEPASKTARDPSLLLLSNLYRILAGIVGFAALIIVVCGVAMGANAAALMVMLGGIIGGFFGVITNLAIAEAILLLIDIEKNTRKG